MPRRADHATFVQRVAGHTRLILPEQPFAASLADAGRMMAACAAHGTRLAINWPLAWYPPRITPRRITDDGLTGQACEVHFHDGNRGLLVHLANKVQVSGDEVERRKPASW